MCGCVCKAPRCLSTAGEIRSVQGHLQRVEAKGRSQPPAGPNSSKLGRRKVRGSVLGIHPEPTLKAEDARPHQPWRSNRAKMQAVNREAFAMPVFNYWHFLRCKSVLSTQQEKTHLHLALTQLVSSDQGFYELQYDELTVNKILQCCWMKDTNTVFAYTLKLWINKMEENRVSSKCVYFCTLWQPQADIYWWHTLNVLFSGIWVPINMYFQMCAVLLSEHLRQFSVCETIPSYEWLK